MASESREESLRGRMLTRTGIAVLSGGFVIALVAAVILGNRIEDLEGVASAAHHLSKVILLVGLLLVLAGYRETNAPRTRRRAARWLGDWAHAGGGGRSSRTELPERPVSHHSLPSPESGRGKRASGIFPVAAILAAVLVVWLWYLQTSRIGQPTMHVVLTPVVIVALLIGPVLSVLCFLSRPPHQAFAIGAVLPWWIGMLLIGVQFSGPLIWGYRGFDAAQLLHELLLLTLFSGLSGCAGVLAWTRLGDREKAVWENNDEQ